MIIAGMCCISALITLKIAYTVSVRNNIFVIFLNVWDKKHAGCQKQNESFVKASNRRFFTFQFSVKDYWNQFLWFLRSELKFMIIDNLNKFSLFWLRWELKKECLKTRKVNYTIICLGFHTWNKKIERIFWFQILQGVTIINIIVFSSIQGVPTKQNLYRVYKLYNIF